MCPKLDQKKPELLMSTGVVGSPCVTVSGGQQPYKVCWKLKGPFSSILQKQKKILAVF